MFEITVALDDSKELIQITFYLIMQQAEWKLMSDKTAQMFVSLPKDTGAEDGTQQESTCLACAKLWVQPSCGKKQKQKHSDKQTNKSRRIQ